MKGAVRAGRVLTPPGEGKPIGRYAAGVEVAAGALVFVAGQVAMDADGHIVGEGDIKAQATQVYRNLAAVLAEAGLTLRDVVKLTTFLTRNEDWAPFGEWRRVEYPRLFPDGVYPPNTGVVVHALARPPLLLEVEAIAVKAGRPAGAARAAPVSTDPCSSHASTTATPRRSPRRRRSSPSTPTRSRSAAAPTSSSTSGSGGASRGSWSTSPSSASSRASPRRMAGSRSGA